MKILPGLEIGIKRLDHGSDLPLPLKATESSSGVDLLAAIKKDLILKPGGTELVPTGIAIELPTGFEAQIRPRSGLAIKHGVTLLNSPGTIDADYRGEIAAIMINHGSEPFLIKRGMRIAQMVLASVTNIKWLEKLSLDDTRRGIGGFGSTGTN